MEVKNICSNCPDSFLFPKALIETLIRHRNYLIIVGPALLVKRDRRSCAGSPNKMDVYLYCNRVNSRLYSLVNDV